MLPAEILQSYDELPNEAQRQVLDFIAFMRSRYKTGADSGLSADEQRAEGSFNSICVPHSVSLEEMDDAIVQGASRL